MSVVKTLTLIEAFDHIRASHPYPDSDVAPTYLMANTSQAITGSRALRDSAPITSAGNFGKSGSPTFYFLDDPNEWELYYQARYTPLGYRLTYGFADDVFNNNWGYKFPEQKLEETKIREINNEIAEHYKEIGVYDMSRMTAAYDYEQGEALLMIYREGDGALKYEQILSDNPLYEGFNVPADTNKKVIRVEAVNKLDYMVPQIESFGASQVYRVNFYTQGNTFKQFNVHSSRAIRWKANNINYNQYKGIGMLHPCFSHLQILNTIDFSAMAAAYRWGGGKPAIFTKGIKNDSDAQKASARIGNPNNQSWLMIPSEQVDKIQMLGLGESGMNLPAMADMVLNQIASVTGIPKPILMGEQAGVISGSEVNERQYFAVLDRQHSKLNHMIRLFNSIDPEFLAILKKYGITAYEIDWGLRQVMTKMEEADYNMRLIQNARSSMGFKTYDEVRASVGLPHIADVPELASQCQAMYGIDAKELGAIIPELGQWKQRVLQEIITTPEEKKAQAEAKELGKNNVPNAIKTNAAEGGQGTSNDPASANKKEEMRRNMKMERKMAGGYSGGDIDIENQMLKDMLKEMQDSVDTIRKENSMYKISEITGIKRDTLYNIFNKIKEAKIEDKP